MRAARPKSYIGKIIAAAGLLACSLFAVPLYATPSADSDNDGVSDGQETIDNTDPDDIDSYMEHGGTEYCFDWNGFLSELTQVLELRNSGCGTIGVRVDLRDIGGEIKDTVNFSLVTSQQFDLIANNLDGFANNTYGLICATITSGDPDSLTGRLSTYQVESNSFTYAFSTPYVSPRTGAQFLSYNNIFPTLNNAEHSNPVYSFVQVSNNEASTQTGRLIFYDFNGTEVRSSPVTIAAKGRIDINTHELGANTVGEIEWSPTLSDKNFRVVLNRYFYSGGTPVQRLAALSVPAKKGSGYLRAAPFSTVSRITALELSNSLNSTVNAAVSIYSSTGALTSSQPGTISIPAKGTRHVVLNDYLLSGLGKVQIASSTPESVIASLFEYGLNSSLGLAFSNVGNLQSGFGSKQTSSYNNFLGGCRMRLANISNTQKTATIDMTRFDQTPIVIDSPLTIPANGVIEVDICSNENHLAYGEVAIVPSVLESLTGEIVRSNPDRSSEFRTPLTERSICTAEINASPSTRSLIANSGAPETVTITNNSASITATNVVATLPAGWGDVSQDSSDCASVGPSETCGITLTPGASTHAQAEVSFQGDNTGRTSMLVTVIPDPTAAISVSGSPLTLETNGTSANLTITNNSSTTAALNIAANFTGTALDGNVTETGNTCASVAPSASCTLTFTPGSTVVSETNFPIQGTNTNSVMAAIEIEQGVEIDTVTASSGTASGGTGVTLSGVNLTGAISVTFGGIAATSVNVVNSTTVTAVTPAHATGTVDVVLTTPSGSATLTNGFTYLTTAVGQSAQGGTIACLNGSLQNLIAAVADNSTAIEWGGNGTTTNATSSTDGATNTQAVVSTLGPLLMVPFAAEICDQYEVDSQGNSPCESGNTCYNDWFLPAPDQLACLYQNKIAIGGFVSTSGDSSRYWTSEETGPFYAYNVFFDSGSPGAAGKSINDGNPSRVRCVRGF